MKLNSSHSKDEVIQRVKAVSKRMLIKLESMDIKQKGLFG